MIFILYLYSLPLWARSQQIHYQKLDVTDIFNILVIKIIHEHIFIFKRCRPYKNLCSRIWKLFSPFPSQTSTAFPRGNVCNMLLVSFLCIGLYPAIYINTFPPPHLLHLPFSSSFSFHINGKVIPAYFLTWIFHLVIYFIDLSTPKHIKLLHFKWLHLYNSINVS